MRNLTLLYSDAEDPLAVSLRAHASVEAMHVDDLTGYFGKEEREIMPSFSVPDAVRARFADKIVLNRVFNLKETGLGTRLKDWKCHEIWGHFLLRQLFADGSRLVHDTGPRGVSRTLLPLNTQWFKVSRLDDPVATPRYVYNFGGESEGLDTLREPFQKSVWSLYDWREERHLPAGEANWHRFFVEKPAGSPVLCYFFDVDRLGEDGLEIVPLRGETTADRQRILALARSLSSTFASAVGEFLFFVEDDGTLRFYAFSPYLSSAANHPAFAGHVERWVSSLH